MKATCLGEATPKSNPGPPGWGLSHRANSPVLVKSFTVKRPNNTSLGTTRTKRTRRQKLRKRTMVFGTWNVQGISNKLPEVISEIQKLGVDVAVLTETKKKGHGSENYGDYDLFYSGVAKDQRAQQGVAILLRRSLRKFVGTWEAVNQRIIKMNLNLYGHKITLLGVYGVNDDATVACKDQFFEDLNDEILNVGAGREAILMGDLNSRTGRRVNCKVVGPFGEDAVNDNGDRLISICSQTEMRILNGFFQHKDIHKYTWVQPTRGLKSIIDYVIVKHTTKLKLQQVRVCRGLSCGSDHHFLRADIAFPVKGIKDKEPMPEQQQSQGTQNHEVWYNIESLEHPSVKALYRKRLDEKLGDGLSGTTEEQYQFIKDCIHSAAKEALGVHKTSNKYQHPYWWDEEIEDEINLKRQKHLIFLSSKKTEDKVAYRKAQSKVRSLITRKKNEAWESNCSRINTYLGGRKSAESWKLIKGLRRDMKRDIVSPISLKKLEDHFKDLLTERRPEFRDNSTDNGRMNNLEIHTCDIIKAVKELINDKAPGPGGIPVELVKYGTAKLFECLRKLMQQCIRGDEVPREWKESWIKAIYKKKGRKDDCNNYRGLSVTGTISKVYGKILKAKIEDEWQDHEAEEQAGFRAGRSTIDHLFVIVQVIEKKMAVAQELHLIFVDLQKAYDSVPLVKLWEALEKSNFNGGLIDAVKRFYKGSFTKIKYHGGLSAGFYVTKGLKQGCCLSPTLFKIYLECVLKEWKRKCSGMGVPLGDLETLFTLCFADDQVVVAQDQDDAEYMMRKLVEEYRKWGLEVSISKSEKMTFGGDQQSIELEDGQQIKGCEHYKYLGVRLTQDGRTDQAIRERNTLARKAIAMLNGILWDQRISKDNKRRIYNAVVKSILTYGCEVWQLKKRTQDMLRATEMDFWRRSAGISRRDRVRNDRVRQIMEVENDIVFDVMTKQLVWYGHVNRMTEERLPKKMLDWVPPGRRRRGRPVRGWRQGVLNEIRDCQLPDDLWEDRALWRLGVAQRQRAL